MKQKILLITFSVLFILSGIAAFLFFYLFGMPDLSLKEKRQNFADIESMLKSGDLIFQTTNSPQSGPISKATHSQITHVGLLEKTENGWMVVEARSPVRYVRIETFFKDGAKSAFAIRRPLFDFDANKVIETAKKHVGKPYDIFFEWSDERIYCSELVYKAFETVTGEKIGEFEKIRDLDFSDLSVQLLMTTRLKPNFTLSQRKKFHEMLSKHKTFHNWQNSSDWDASLFEKRIIDFLDSGLITPDAQYQSPRLTTIYTDYL